MTPSWLPSHLPQYDHAYTLETRKERLESLKGALWRGVYMSDDRIQEAHVQVVAEYIDSELADMYNLNAVRLPRLLAVRVPRSLFSWQRWTDASFLSTTSIFSSP